jgi:hypothetical protein
MEHFFTGADLILWLILGALYIAFVRWYGGKRTPLTQAEGAAFLDRMRAQRPASYAEAHPEFRPNLERLIAKDDGREFFMVNLENQTENAEALAAAKAYGRTVMPLLLARGSFPVYRGTPIGPVYGNFGAGINRVAIVRYRSLYDLLDMIVDPKMTQGGAQKFAALTHTDVFASRPAFSAVTIRLVVALLLLVSGLGLHIAINHLLS